MTHNPLLDTKVGADSATESLLQTARDLFSTVRTWKETGLAPRGVSIGMIETLANRVSRQARELQDEVENTPSQLPQSARSGDELIPFALDLIAETQPGDTDKGGLLVFLPDGKTKDWIAKSKIKYNIIEYPVPRSVDQSGKRGRVEIHIPRWLARKKEMI